ncbi:MAG: endonuclease/exonuclease/phosphatase family protein [Paracoccaceae bacterium]
MRVAAYNVENLFDRAKAFNGEDADSHSQVLDSFAELNSLFAKATYSAADKSRMLVLIEQLGMLHRDEGTSRTFTRIRKIRGKLIKRPRDAALPREIVADGRDGWVGWCELKSETVDEIAMTLTAKTIWDVDADILAVVEAESRPVLLEFQRVMSDRLGRPKPYRHIMIIDGNDGRGIDVGLATKTGFPIGVMRSHVDDLKPDGFPIFSRDCPEYEVTTPQGTKIIVLPNHFKSKFGGNNPASQAKRLAQATATADYYNRLINEGVTNIIVLGDFNDTPDSDELEPLLIGTDLRDVSEHTNFVDFEFNANNGHRGIGTHGLGNDGSKIDYLLLSPALFQNVTTAGIFRKGAWPGSSPKRWDVYPEMTQKHHAASDHHLIWADIDI